MTPGAAHAAPRGAQDSSKGAQEPHRSSQDALKSSLEGHIGCQEAPKSPPQRLPGAAQGIQRGSKNAPRKGPRRVQVPLTRLSAGQAPPNDVATRLFWVQSLPKLAASTTKAQSNSTC